MQIQADCIRSSVDGAGASGPHRQLPPECGCRRDRHSPRPFRRGRAVRTGPAAPAQTRV